MEPKRGSDGKYHIVYKTIVNETGKFYIGKHSTRILEDGYFGSGKLIGSFIEKYGVAGLTREILAFCESAKDAFQKEKELVGDLYRLDENCMNLQPGGGGGFKDEEHRIKAQLAGASLGGKAAKEKHAGWFSDETRAKITDAIHRKMEEGFKPREAMTKAAASLEAREKKKKTMAERNHQQGEKNSNFGNRSIHKDSVTIKVKSGELDEYLADGWKLGTKEKLVRVNLTAEKQKIRQEQYQKLQPRCRNCGISLTFQKFVSGHTSCSKACSNSSRFKV